MTRQEKCCERKKEKGLPRASSASFSEGEDYCCFILFCVFAFEEEIILTMYYSFSLSSLAPGGKAIRLRKSCRNAFCGCVGIEVKES